MASIFSGSNNHKQHESLRINISKRKVKGVLLAIGFIDKETLQHILYIPSLQISGYGETKDKAMKMLKECQDYYFEVLFQKSAKEIHAAQIVLDENNCGTGKIEIKDREWFGVEQIENVYTNQEELMVADGLL